MAGATQELYQRGKVLGYNHAFVAVLLKHQSVYYAFMNLRLRFWMVWLLCLALSSQSFAVASLRICHRTADTGALVSTVEHGIAKRPVASEAATRLHDDDRHQSAMHDHPKTDSDAQKHDSQKKQDRGKCAACAGCCHFAALPVDFEHAPHFDGASHTFFPLDQPRFRNGGSGLERPPRT